MGRGVGGRGYKPWQGRAVAPFTVVVNSEINGDAVAGASDEGPHCCGAVIYMGPSFVGDRRLCCEHLFLIFHQSGGPRCGWASRGFLFKFQKRKESHSDILYKLSGE